MSVHVNKQQIGRFSKERIGILGIWFLLLIGVRTLLSLALRDVWLGTVGAVGITFAIFYFSLRYTRLGKYAPKINQVITGWYKKRYFYVSAAAIVCLSAILLFIDNGYIHYSDKLVTIDVDTDNNPFHALAASEYAELSLQHDAKDYSYIDILSITFASADKTLGGYYSKIVSYMLAEDIEILAFLFFIQKRKEIFSSAKQVAA